MGIRDAPILSLTKIKKSLQKKITKMEKDILALFYKFQMKADLDRSLCQNEEIGNGVEVSVSAPHSSGELLGREIRDKKSGGSNLYIFRDKQKAQLFFSTRKRDQVGAK